MGCQLVLPVQSRDYLKFSKRSVPFHDFKVLQVPSALLGNMISQFDRSEARPLEPQWVRQSWYLSSSGGDSGAGRQTGRFLG